MSNSRHEFPSVDHMRYSADLYNGKISLEYDGFSDASKHFLEYLAFLINDSAHHGRYEVLIDYATILDKLEPHFSIDIQSLNYDAYGIHYNLYTGLPYSFRSHRHPDDPYDALDSIHERIEVDTSRVMRFTSRYLRAQGYDSKLSFYEESGEKLFSFLISWSPQEKRAFQPAPSLPSKSL